MFTSAAGWSGALQRSATLADKAERAAVCLRSVTAGFHNSQNYRGSCRTNGPCCPTEHVGHLSWEISTQAEAESRGQPQTCEPNCRRQWFLSYLVCCHSPAPGFWHTAPAAGSLLVSQCCSLHALGGEDKAAPTQGWSKRDTFQRAGCCS